LKNTCGSSSVQISGGPYNTAGGTEVEKECVPNNQEYEFSIIDGYGDGICCGHGQGSYTVKFDGADVTGGQFGSVESKLIGTCGDGCGAGKAEVEIAIVLDNYPEETTWELKNTCGSSSVQISGGPYNTAGGTEVEKECVPNNQEYEFSIIDGYGDGICCGHGQGSYTVKFDGADVTGGQFGSVESNVLGTCG